MSNNSFYNNAREKNSVGAGDDVKVSREDGGKASKKSSVDQPGISYVWSGNFYNSSNTWNFHSVAKRDNLSDGKLMPYSTPLPPEYDPSDSDEGRREEEEVAFEG